MTGPRDPVAGADSADAPAEAPPRVEPKPALAVQVGGLGLLSDILIPLAIVGLVGALAIGMLAPLFPAMLWGAMLAVVCAHPYENLVSRLHGRRALGDAIFAVILVLALILPAVFFA